MGPFQWFLFVYVLGGLTFIPLLVGVALYIGWRNLPVENPSDSKARADDPAELTRASDTELVLKTATDDLAEKFHRKHDSDVAAGYFAVCREWVPGGVNGKPPDRLSPAGETIAQESPSVYQTMYRSLFDRTQKPTIEPHKDGAGKNVKKANNIFYVVLRHGHLMLYDDIQQLEVRYVISLEYHNVDIYGGGEDIIPEGELWVKRHAIRLTRKVAKGAAAKTSLPFFLFSENLSEKEDFYHALLKNQERTAPEMPVVEDFDPAFIVKLVQKLHSSEEQLQTRWLNAIIGRLFLATYKTPELEDFVRAKLTKKISRVKKPTFITRLSLHKIDTGSGAPFLTNPRLKDLTVNGDCVAEMDVEYTGGFRIEIGATARIDLGKRFGAREVDMLLAVTLKKVQGHMLLRFKPPPSNRLWFTFEKMPQMDLALEPIVSSRKITYGVILSAMESRIREVFAESLVLPFWDDIPFLDTSSQKHRGGIFKREKTDTPVDIKDETPEDEADTAAGSAEAIKSIKADPKNWSMPALSSDDASAAQSKSADRRSIASLPGGETPVASDGDKTPPISTRAPRMMRAPSFANVADPAVTTNNIDSDDLRADPEATPKREAAAFLKDLSARSGSPSEQQESSSPPKESAMAEAMQKGRPARNPSKASIDNSAAPSRTSTIDVTKPPSLRGNDSRPSTPLGPQDRDSKRSSTMDDTKSIKSFAQNARSMTAADRKQAIASATASAQRWGSSLGWGVLTKKPKEPTGAERPPGTTESGNGAPTTPMGRGQPLPPPGQPLPRPPKPNNLMSNIPSFMVPKKPALPKRPDPEAASSASPKLAPSKPPPPPLPDRRRRKSTMQDHSDNGDDLLVVEAPMDSAPTSPEAERSNANRDDFFGHSEDADDPRRHPHSRQEAQTTEERRQDQDTASADPPPYDSSSSNKEPQHQPTERSSPSLSGTSYLSDKETATTSATFSTQQSYRSAAASAPALPPRNNTHPKPTPAPTNDSIEDLQLPRPPPPARTGSDSSDGRRLSRIPSPVGSLGKRKSVGLVRQPSNLSLHSGGGES